MARVAGTVVLLSMLALSPATASAQTREDAQASEARDAFLAERSALMWTLGGWAASSIAVGSVMAAEGDRSVRAAGVQNIAWGAVDGALAAFALVGGRHDHERLEPADAWRQKRVTLARIFVVNALLDVAYVAVGSALLLFAKDDALRGAGAGVLVQGGFLLTFDTTGALLIRARP